MIYWTTWRCNNKTKLTNSEGGRSKLVAASVCGVFTKFWVCYLLLYYRIKGVERTADLTELKKGYYKASLQWHPDKNSSEEATAKFQEIQEAYRYSRYAKAMKF